MSVEYVAYSESAFVSVSGDPVPWNHTLSVNADRVLAICFDRITTSGAQKITACTVGGENATERVSEASGGTDASHHMNIWTFKVPSDWDGVKEIIGTGGVHSGHGWAIEVKGASGEVGKTGSSVGSATVTLTDTLVTSLIVDRYGRDNANTPVSNQTLIDTRAYAPADDRFDTGHAISRAAGGGNVTMSYTLFNTPCCICAVELLVAAPLWRERLIKYFASTFDPSRRILGRLGRNVPKDQIEVGAWFRAGGPFFISPIKPASLIEEKDVWFIESLRYEARNDEVNIEAISETQLENLMRRLGEK